MEYYNWIDLGPPGHNYFLTFWEFVSTEEDFDFCKVQISTNGTQWSDLASYSGSFNWHFRTIPLSNYSGPVKIRFAFFSNSLNEFEGWYIDDIRIFERWRQLNPPNPYITDLYIYNYSTYKYLFATSENFPKPPQTPNYYGNILKYDNFQWSSVSVSGIDYLSIDGPPYTKSGFILAGTSGNGIYYTENAGNFSQWNSSNIPVGSFVSVSVDGVNPSGDLFLL